MTDLPTTVAAICQNLVMRIQSGEFKEGRLPSERLMSECYSTTRITLREALGQLEGRGLIYREERRGWFISPPRIIYNPLQRSHFHAMVREQGRVARTEVLEYHPVIADLQVAGKLGVEVGSTLYCIKRRRSIDDRLVLYVEHYLNPEYFEGILQEDLTKSLTDIYLSRYGIRYGRVRFDMVPTLLPKEATQALKITAASPGLFITRVNRDQHDRIIDCDLEYWRYDALHIDVEAG